MTNKKVLVIFENDAQIGPSIDGKFDVIVSSKSTYKKVQSYCAEWKDLDDYVSSSNIYEASSLLINLSEAKFGNGEKVAKQIKYKDYELWWINYSHLFLYYCLPHTQYKKLLNYLKDFDFVVISEPPREDLFSCFFEAYEKKVKFLKRHQTVRFPIPFGNLIQCLFTVLSLPLLMLDKKYFLLYTGDKFDEGKDYDFRMRFIYKELRERNLLFVEYIRSLFSWKIVIKNFFIRRRPVVYPEALLFIGRIISMILGGRIGAKWKINSLMDKEKDPNNRFINLLATRDLMTYRDDIWSIRLNMLVLKMIGVKVAFIASAADRNFHTVIACKILNIPIVGLLHGVANRHNNVYDFMAGFDGPKKLSVDFYGVWSDWWKKYFEIYSDAYESSQLVVSGPMRPTAELVDLRQEVKRGDKINILFISEEVAIPEQILPYLEILLNDERFDLTIKFRPYVENSERWLNENRPDVLNSGRLKIVRGKIEDAIKSSDIVVGSYSTAVLEALAQLKVPIYFQTEKWGDYYELSREEKTEPFYANNPQELVEKVLQSRNITTQTLKELRVRYFGDPTKNGSQWAVDQMEELYLAIKNKYE